MLLGCFTEDTRALDFLVDKELFRHAFEDCSIFRQSVSDRFQSENDEPIPHM